ncbi:MAG: thrombospondin type 3 repeat-containing protein [Candidatus Freyarchaeota archaeon]
MHFVCFTFLQHLDGWEVQHSLDSTSDGSGQNSDGDGFSNLEEFNSGTDPTSSASAPAQPASCCRWF